MPLSPASLTAGFNAAMAALGPFETAPAIAVAVSGGADSMALAILARQWASQRGGTMLALIVDHGLRPASAHEAHLTIQRLARIDIPCRLLPLSGLRHGPALAERARVLRYETLTDACAKAGILHLLLGHHAADQVETLMMRVLRDSQTHGLAGMAALRETASLRLLRPLLMMPPAMLRQALTAQGVGWVEDPSNQDRRATRPRLRQRLAVAAGQTAGLLAAVSSAARLRQQDEADIAAELARRTTIRPEGFAVLSPGRISAAALAGLIQAIAGTAYPPAAAQVADLAAQPRSATIAGVRLLVAGRGGDRLLVAREEAAIGHPVPALAAAVWDNRFRVTASPNPPNEAEIGKLGPDAARFRGRSDLPSAILRTLPAIRIGQTLVAVPHLGYASEARHSGFRLAFSPRKPAAGAAFLPPRQGV